MTNRRVDAVYFGLIVVAALVAYFGSEFTADEPSRDEMADLEFPEIQSEFEFPMIDLPELPFVFKRSTTDRGIATRNRPVRRSSDEIESALIRVRSVLLATANPTEFAHAE